MHLARGINKTVLLSRMFCIVYLKKLNNSNCIFNKKTHLETVIIIVFSYFLFFTYLENDYGFRSSGDKLQYPSLKSPPVAIWFNVFSPYSFNVVKGQTNVLMFTKLISYQIFIIFQIQYHNLISTFFKFHTRELLCPRGIHLFLKVNFPCQRLPQMLRVPITRPLPAFAIAITSSLCPPCVCTLSHTHTDMHCTSFLFPWTSKHFYLGFANLLMKYLSRKKFD